MDRPVWGLLMVAGALAGLTILALADDADATHFWAGTLTGGPGPVDGVYAVDGHLSFDSRHIAGLAGVPVDEVCDAPLEGLRLSQAIAPELLVWQWGSLAVRDATTGQDFHVPFELLVEETDPEHCRFSARMVGPGTDGPVQVLDPQPLPTVPTEVRWSICGRLNDPAHVNNPNGCAGLRASINGSNGAPRVDFPAFGNPPLLSEVGHGHIHCPSDTLCRFPVAATDAEGDALRYRLATTGEAAGGPGRGFQHPPSLSVDSKSGIITWDTSGTSLGDLYSTQVVIEDGRGGSTAIDFMIEIAAPLPPCPDGTAPVIDPETGQVTCPDVCDQEPTPDWCLPQAGWYASTYTPYTAEEVEFTSMAWSRSGPIVHESWDFGDGSSANGSTVRHAYSEDGTYTVTLTATDSEGNEGSFGRNITVQNRAPAVQYTYVADDLYVSFNGTASDPDGSVVAWSWDFGDGKAADVADPTHTYADSGTYLVTVTVTDDDGGQGSFSQNVTVVAPNVAPGASFEVSGKGTTADFLDTSTDMDGTVVSWSWDFGDGATSTEQSPFHRFAPGVYTVRLTVTDDDGAVSAAERTLTVPLR